MVGNSYFAHPLTRSPISENRGQTRTYAILCKMLLFYVFSAKVEILERNICIYVSVAYVFMSRLKYFLEEIYYPLFCLGTILFRCAEIKQVINWIFFLLDPAACTNKNKLMQEMDWCIQADEASNLILSVAVTMRLCKLIA